MKENTSLARRILGSQVANGRIAQGYVTAKDTATNSYTVAPSSDAGAPTASGIRALVPIVVGDVVWLQEGPGGVPIIVNHLDTGWHYIGDLGEPAFTNSWSNLDAPEATWSKAGFRKVSGVVSLTGGVSGGANGAVAFILPVGFRPRKFHGEPTFTSGPNNFTYTEVSSVGQVYPETNVNALNNAGILLTGVSFIADQ